MSDDSKVTSGAGEAQAESRGEVSGSPKGAASVTVPSLLDACRAALVRLQDIKADFDIDSPYTIGMLKDAMAAARREA